MKVLLLAVFCGLCACALANYQSIDGDVSQDRREVLKQTLLELGQIIAKYEDIQEAVGNRIAQLQAQLDNSAGLSGFQADRALREVRQGIDLVAQNLVQQIIKSERASGEDGGVSVQLVINSVLRGQRGSNQGYSSQLVADSAQQQLLGQLREQVEGQLRQLESLVGGSIALRREYQDRINNLRQEQQALSAQNGPRTIQSYIFLRGQIQNVYNSVVARIDGGLDYSAQSEQQQLVQQLRNQVEQDLRQLENTVAQSLVLQQEFGQRVSELRTQQQALSQESGRRVIQSYLYLQGIIRNVHRSVVQRIDGGLDYAAQEEQEQEQNQQEQQFEQQIKELQEQVSSQVQQIEDLINENVAVQTEFASRLAQLKSQQESASQRSGYKAVRTYLSLQRQIQQVYYNVIQRVKDVTSPDQEQQEKILQQQIEQLRQQIDAQLQQLDNYLAQTDAEIQSQYEKRVTQLKTQQEATVQQVGYEAVRALLSLQQRIQKTYQSAIESVQQQEQQKQQIQQLTLQVENQLQQLETYVDQNEALKTKFESPVTQLRQQQQSASQLTGSQALRALQSIQRQARQIARDAKKQQQQQDQIQKLGDQIETQLQQLEASIEQNEALKTEYANKLTQLRSQQQTVAQQSGSSALRGLEALRRNVKQVARSIQEQQRQQQQIQELNQQIEDQLTQLEQVVAEDEALLTKYANRFAQLRTQQQSASQQKGYRALRSLQSLIRRVRQVTREVQQQLQQQSQIELLQLQIESGLKQAEELAAQTPELQSQYSEQLTKLRAQQQAALLQKGNQAIRSLSTLSKVVQQVLVAIFANQGQEPVEQY